MPCQECLLKDENIDSLVFWMEDLLRLARELQKDLMRFYHPDKGWPPHISALLGETDYDTVLKQARSKMTTGAETSI